MSDDSWKGEGLIRSVPRDRRNGGSIMRAQSMDRTKAKDKERGYQPRYRFWAVKSLNVLDLARDTCAHPGCDRALRPNNQSGVCQMHIHTSACQCRRCIDTTL